MSLRETTMPADSSIDVSAEKTRIRGEALARRRDQPDKEAASRTICERLAALPEYQAAKTILFYLDARSEARTRSFVAEALDGPRRIVVPYCSGAELELFLLESMAELQTGQFGILEPSVNLRSLPEKSVGASEVDLIVVPGVAFSPDGARLGHGHGYYDRLLRRARPEAPRIGLAFDCQIYPALPTQPHDIFMTHIVTQSRVYPQGTSGR